MTDRNSRTGEKHGYSRLFLILLGLAILAAIAGLGWSYHLSGRLTHAEAQLMQAQQQNQKLASALNDTNARLKLNENLGHSLGARQKQLQQRARDLLKRQQAAAKRPESEDQQAAHQQISSASGSPGDTEAGTGNTQSELKAAEAKLQRTKGDLGIESGPVATNQQELEALKQKGDRNYYEFTLKKGKKQPVSNVSLELKKADVKHNRYTLIVYTNNVKIQKKDRELNQPVQFYSGKDNSLYELVVNGIQKNEVTGYLATPLNATANSPGS